MTLKICHISDSHLQILPELPEADVLVHTGDALNSGSLSELEQFRQQLLQVKDKYDRIIFIPGNHDRIFEDTYHSAKQFLEQEVNNLTVLNHEPYDYKGYKWFGTSFQPFIGRWAFGVKDNLDLYEKYRQIPIETEILLTHCPPKGILDFHSLYGRLGSKALTLALKELPNLKAHLFGHIHEAYGLDYKNKVWYSNAALCNEDYEVANEPRIIELE